MRGKSKLCYLLLSCSLGLLGGVRAYADAADLSVVQLTGVCKGKVVDSAGEPIIGASVVVKGTTNGTITDMDGNYSIHNVEQGATIEVSFVGYKTMNGVFTVGKALDFKLLEDSKMLSDVVVVGFGSQKKANLTGAVTSVKMSEALGDRPLTSVSQALQGAVPGLHVGSGGNGPGAQQSFQIRGAYSIGSGSVIAPLVLIDNVEGDINMLNPNDIASVSVLKDAASSAIYGARAAGGVILITTKHPESDRKFQINYNNNFSLSKAINLPEQTSLMAYLQSNLDRGFEDFWSYGTPDIKRWMELLTQYQSNPSSVQTVGDGMFKDTNGAVYYLNEKNLMENMFETSFKQQHNISVSGGTQKLRFRLSAGYLNDNGVMITDKDTYRRMTLNSYLSADITDWFTQEATISYGASKSSMPLSFGGGLYTTRLASFYPEGIAPQGLLNDYDGLPFFTPANQIKYSNSSYTNKENPRIFLKSIFKPTKNLTLNFEYTYDKDIWDYSFYTGQVIYTTIQGDHSPSPSIDYLDKRNSFTNYNAINLYGTYAWNLASNHHFTLMAGFNQESSYYQSLTNRAELQAVKEVPSLGGGSGTLTAKDGYSEYSVRGGFFRLNYNYQDKYLLELNGRYDGSSKFPKENRFGFFPSVSAGWNIAQESFMEKANNWLDQLKLRGSYGSIGNQNIAPYAFLPTMDVNNKYTGWLNNGNVVTAVTSLPALVSAMFTWEKVSTFNVGLDFGFLRNRLNGSFEWYQRNTSGMLSPGVQLPAVVGANAPMENTADMRTRGWEFNLNWRDIIGKVGYSIGVNISDNKSVITKYDNNSSKMLSSYYEGQQLGEIWGYEYDGYYSVNDFVDTKTWQLKDGVARINGTNPRPGDVKFKNLRDDDIVGENVISGGNDTAENPGDRKIIGNSQPRFTYGLNLGVNYAGFDLAVFLQGTGKRDAWIANTLTFPLYADHKFIPLYKGTEDYWRPVDAANGNYEAVNPNAEFPRIYDQYGNMGSNYRISDRYLSNAAYMRIKNVSLSYSFKPALIHTYGLNALKLFVNVENLATFTSLKKGIDPETLSWNYPSFRTVSFGLNVSL